MNRKYIEEIMQAMDDMVQTAVTGVHDMVEPAKRAFDKKCEDGLGESFRQFLDEVLSGEEDSDDEEKAGTEAVSLVDVLNEIAGLFTESDPEEDGDTAEPVEIEHNTFKDFLDSLASNGELIPLEEVIVGLPDDRDSRKFDVIDVNELLDGVKIIKNPSTPDKPKKRSTTVIWGDGTITIVKPMDNTEMDDYQAFTAAFAKRCLGNNTRVRKVVAKTETIKSKAQKKQESKEKKKKAEARKAKADKTSGTKKAKSKKESAAAPKKQKEKVTDE